MDQLPSTPNIYNAQRYYCHVCREEVRVTNLTCVQCLGGFVEEITAESTPNVERILRMLRRNETNDPNEFSSRDSSNSNTINSSANIIEMEESIASTSSGTNACATTTHTDSGTVSGTASGSGTTPSTEVPASTSERTNNFRGAIMDVLMDALDLMGSIHNNHNTATTAESSGTSPNDAPNTSTSRRFRDLLAARYSATDNRDMDNQNAWNAFFDFALSSAGGSLNANVNPGNQMFAMGDPQNNGGRDEDLANMVMNSINHLFPLVSRPMSDDKLQLIPKVEVNAEDLANQDTCAICWDEFQLQEVVRKLPCTHLFHESCVFPWLKLHRTCPLCRTCLNDDHGCAGFRRQESHDGESSGTTESSNIDLSPNSFNGINE